MTIIILHPVSDDKLRIHLQSLEWEPEGWWTPLGLPDFPRRQWLENEGNYIQWRLNKWRKRILMEISRQHRGRREPQKSGTRWRRPPRGKSLVRYEAAVGYHLAKELGRRGMAE